MHYYRKRRGSHKQGPAQLFVCSMDGCDRPHRAKGFCDAHYQRLWKGTDLAKPIRRAKTPIRDGWYVNSEGYLYRTGKRGDGKYGVVLQHRLIMEGILGRPLTDKETVHHKNGVRDDNRPENLELWASRHPRGSRIEDLVEFALEILNDYADSPALR